MNKTSPSAVELFCEAHQQYRKTTKNECAADEALLCARTARDVEALDTLDADAVHRGLDDVGKSTEELVCESVTEVTEPKRATLGSRMIRVVQNALVRRGLSEWCGAHLLRDRAGTSVARRRTRITETFDVDWFGRRRRDDDG
jgi:hypothetical protein